MKWPTLLVFTLFHAGAVVALFMFSWTALAIGILLYWVAGSLGIGMGYHRLLTHRGYKTTQGIERFLTLCGALALEGGPITWVVTHRIHHAYSDQEGDPHSPRDGGWWWAHIGWMLAGKAYKDHPAISWFYDAETFSRYAPDLMKDRFYVWLERYHFLPLVLLALTLFAFGGWPLVLWGVFLRVTLLQHATWLVNSATHLWGARRFATRDNSRNNWWVALVTFGEGWHNNHHAHPASARHGLAWYEIDLNWWGIRTLELLGLAHSLQQIRLKPHIPQAEVAGQPSSVNPFGA